MKVSVIIPCFNHYRFIFDAINSVEKQSYKDIEIIIVDDCSTDLGNNPYWKTFYRLYADSSHKDSKVIFLTHEHNQGLSATRNTGIRWATGELILPLDADDKIHPDCIAKMVDCYNKGTQDIISSYLETFGQYSRISKPFPLCPTWNDLKMANRINCCSLYSKEMWEKLEGYDEKMKNGYEDWEFWARASKNGYKIYTIPEILFYYRKHEPGTSMLDHAKIKRQSTINYMKTKGSI